MPLVAYRLNLVEEEGLNQVEGRQGGREKGTRKGEDGRKLEGRGEVECKEEEGKVSVKT